MTIEVALNGWILSCYISKWWLVQSCNIDVRMKKEIKVKIIRTNHLWRRKQPERLKLRGARVVAVWGSAFSWNMRKQREREESGLRLRSEREHSVLFEWLQEKATELRWNYINATGTILLFNQNLLGFHFSKTDSFVSKKTCQYC